MATVPVVDQIRTSIGQSNARLAVPGGPSAGAIAGEDMQRQGQAVQQLAGQAGRIFSDITAQANQVRVNDAMNQAIQAKLTATYDPQAGFVHLRGRAALERPNGKSLDDEYSANLQTQLDGIRDSLGNDEQKRIFGQQAAQLLTQFKGSVQQHVAKEYGEFQIGVQDGTIKTAQNQMGLAWGDVDSVSQSRNAIKAAVVETGRLAGWSATQTEAAMVDQLSRGHLAVVMGAMQAGKIDYATEYAKQVDGELTNDARLRIKGSLEVENARQKAQAFGDQAIADGMSMSDALKAAREKFAGKEEDEAVREVHQRYQELEVGKQRAAKDIGNQAWSEVMATGKVSPSTLTTLRAVAPEEERQIRDWQEAKWRRAKADAEGKTTSGFDVYYGLRRLAMDDPAAFAGLDLRKSAPLLGKGQLESLVDIQGTISKGDAKAMQSQSMVKQTLGLIKSEIAAVGIDLTPKEGTPQAQETNKFLGALTMALDDAARAKGSPLTPEESRRIGMSMVREGIEQGSGIFGMFQTKRKGYQIATDPDIKPGTSFVVSKFDDIPPAVRDQLVAELRARQPGTRKLTAEQEAMIERAYTRGVDQGRFK